MSAIIPNEGETRLLLELLDGGTAREDWHLQLYQNAYSPVETDTTTQYTEATFTNYTAGGKTLTRTVQNLSTWNTVAQVTPTGSWSAELSVAESAYQQQSWTCGSAVQNTIYGYYIVGASSGKVIMAERFAVQRALQSGDQLLLTPRFGVS